MIKKLLAMMLLLACVTPVAQAQWKKTVAGTTLQRNYGPLNLNGQALNGVASLSSTGTAQVGSLVVNGTSYGGTIQTCFFVSPSLSGTERFVNTILSGTISGSVVNTGTSIGETLLNPVLSGTVSGSVVKTGTTTGGTINSPTLSGTSSGILQGADIAVASGTASPTAINTIRISGTSLLIWSGSNWITK